MNTAIWIALIGGLFSALGWLVNHILAGRAQRVRVAKEASLRHVEQQLSELYGPLTFLVHEGRRTFLDLLDSLGRDHVFSDKPLTDDELKTWLFWADNDLIPRNNKIKKLLMSHTHLIDGAEFPQAYVAFLDHHNSWIINHTRWQKESIPYSWHSKTKWPADFEDQVLTTFQKLKLRHAELLGELRVA